MLLARRAAAAARSAAPRPPAGPAGPPARGPLAPALAPAPPRRAGARRNAATAAAASRIGGDLAAAIAVGAPLYNSGDAQGCFLTYRGAAQRAAAGAAASAEEAALLRAALLEAAERGPSEAAWVLRRAFDQILDGSVAAMAAARAAVPPGAVDFPVLDCGEGLPAAAPRWQVLDDVVMGGASSSSLGFSEAARALVFAGSVTTAFNGGFASVRSFPWAGWAALGGARGVRLVLRGDGRTYKLNLKTDDSWDGVAWQADFETAAPRPDGAAPAGGGGGAAGWQTVDVPFSDFLPTLRGRVVGGARPLEGGSVRQLGFMVSKFAAAGGPVAGFREGEFRLEVARHAGAGSEGAGADGSCRWELLLGPDCGQHGATSGPVLPPVFEVVAAAAAPPGPGGTPMYFGLCSAAAGGRFLQARRRRSSSGSSCGSGGGLRLASAQLGVWEQWRAVEGGGSGVCLESRMAPGLVLPVRITAVGEWAARAPCTGSPRAAAARPDGPGAEREMAGVWLPAAAGQGARACGAAMPQPPDRQINLSAALLSSIARHARLLPLWRALRAWRCAADAGARRRDAAEARGRAAALESRWRQWRRFVAGRRARALQVERADRLCAAQSNRRAARGLLAWRAAALRRRQLCAAAEALQRRSARAGAAKALAAWRAAAWRLRRRRDASAAAARLLLRLRAARALRAWRQLASGRHVQGAPAAARGVAAPDPATLPLAAAPATGTLAAATQTEAAAASAAVAAPSAAGPTVPERVAAAEGTTAAGRCPSPLQGRRPPAQGQRQLSG
ncbi:hypothetical protein Rsub_01968 [Raphidocelis subcapitata]|uniref:NADH:ubiquinone oxidoreductase intermediate-associated protein 30 domain-containing protein n=1 Tax=Raphidocelis subcapitata TaxID=307507 RepID=A0A2V0NP73_9CHLO|nr:hypothetical protein Rsub_01968 [Raphidocelis subcapitata]|eukprot:GBF89396.1 hypothetical protein Rsub_01968 [Raphidocelis subcapitata]